MYEAGRAKSRPPLWFNGQNSWLQIQRSRVLFLALPDFVEILGLERGLLSLVRIIEELLEWKSSGSVSRKSRLTAVGIRYADHATPSIANVGINFADMQRSLGQYSYLRTKSHGV
jgi:hypothetical protein